MWRHIVGVKRPGETIDQTTKKINETETEKTNVQEEAKKKNRLFNEKWRAGREWLGYDPTKKLMFCIDCRIYGTDKSKSMSFVIGTTNLKLETIKDHEVSNGHIHSLATKRAKTGLLEESVAVKSLVSMKSAQLDKMKLLFRNVHAIGKKGRPFTDYLWMCEVDEQKGLNVGNTYRNINRAKEFMFYIAEAERKKLKETIASTKFLSVMSDGSTDSAVMEEELVYVRCARAGKVEVCFAGIQSVDKADATHIAEAICLTMETVSGSSEDDATGQWKEKLVACGTDGAAVMTGVKRGVVSKLRGERSYILGIHCMSHRLELAYSDAVSKNALARKVDDLLSGLYSFYHKSCLNRSNLKKSCGEIGLKPLMPTRIGGTRWVAHFLRALDHFLRGYKGLVHHLEQTQSSEADGNAVQKAKARGFLHIAKDGAVIKFSCFLHDMLTQLSNLSLTLQTSSVTVAEVHDCLASTQAVMLKYKSRPGPMLKTVLGTNHYEGVSLKPCDDRSLNQSKDELIDLLSKRMDDRFGDVSHGILRITRFQYWPDADRNADFGDSDMEELITHFKPVLLTSGVNVEQILDQWTVLKSRLYQDPKILHNISWPEVSRQLGQDCPDILHLVDLILCIPASTADCERGFSTMKQVKSDWRSCLKSQTLSDLLTVQLSSASIKDFDPAPAIELWHLDSIRSRRPEFMDQRDPQRRNQQQDEDSDESLEDI